MKLFWAKEKSEKIIGKISALEKTLTEEAVKKFGYSIRCPVCDRNLKFEGKLINTGTFKLIRNSFLNFPLDCQLYECQRCNTNSIWVFGILPMSAPLLEVMDPVTYGNYIWEWEKPIEINDIYDFDGWYRCARKGIKYEPKKGIRLVKYSNKSRDNRCSDESGDMDKTSE